MKASTAYLLTTLLGAAQVRAACVEGFRQEISPGYIVEHKCNIYRQGENHKNINSEAECAALAKEAGVTVSTYYAPRKQCIVAKEGGKDLTYAGATYMQKVEEVEEEDPFVEDPEDPFAATCEEHRDTLKADLDKCHADLEAASKKPSLPPTCGVAKWGGGWYDRKGGMNIANCKITCNADPKCLSYSAHWDNKAGSNCYLYDKETADVPPGSFPNWVQYDKRCG